jgi:hypothetical protein
MSHLSYASLWQRKHPFDIYRIVAGETPLGTLPYNKNSTKAVEFFLIAGYLIF